MRKKKDSTISEWTFTLWDWPGLFSHPPVSYHSVWFLWSRAQDLEMNMTSDEQLSKQVSQQNVYLRNGSKSPSPSAQIFTWPPFKIWSCVCFMLLLFSWMHCTRSKFLTFTDIQKISIWCMALTLKKLCTKSAQKVNRNVSPFLKGFSMDFLNHRRIRFPHIKISHYWISLFTLCIQTDTKMWKWGHQKLTCVHR